MDAGFPKLEVLSTDEDFQERDERATEVTDSSMYKLLRLQGLGLRVSPAGVADISRAEDIVTPLTASLKLAHLPGESTVRLRLEVATDELAEVLLRRSQVKHMRAFKAAVSREKQRIFQLIVPPAEQTRIFDDLEHSRDEYSSLYERYTLERWVADGEVNPGTLNVYPQLTAAELKRMQMLEDAFSIRVVAVARLKVQNKLEKVYQELARRQVQIDEDRKEKAGVWNRLMGRRSVATSEPEEEPFLDPKEQAMLLADIEDESKVEQVDLPGKYQFEFVLGKLALDLIDDRWQDEVRRQLFSAAVKEAEFKVNVRMATDHRGQDSAEWRLELGMGAFHAFHRTQAFFTFCPPPEDQDRWMANISHIQPLVESSSNAAKFVIESSLKPDMNLLALTFEFSPVQIHMLPGIVEHVKEFWSAPPVPEDVSDMAEEKDDGDLRKEDLKDMTKQVLEVHGDQVKKVAEQLYARTPDRLQVNLVIHSPILHVPVRTIGTSILSFGKLSMYTEPCAYTSIDMHWKLDNTAVTAKSSRGERFDMIQPVAIQMGMEYRSSEDENKLTIQIFAEELILAASPQALQILLGTPGGIVGILSVPADEQPPPADSAAVAAVATGAPNVAAAVPTAWSTASLTTPGGTHVGLGIRRLRTLSGMSDVEPGTGADTRTMAERAKSLAQQVIPEKLLRKDGASGEDVIQVAVRKVEQVRKKQFRLNLEVQWEALEVTLSDSVLPVLRLRMELMHPGFVWYQQSIPYTMTLNILNSSLEMDVLNPRNGAWEPLAERCTMAWEVQRWQVDEERRGTHMIISGQEPLLLNFKPAMLQRAKDVIPLFLEAFTAQELVNAVGEVIRGDDCKYRIVNLCEAPVEIHFKTKHRCDLRTTIGPTGTKWESLDQWVLQHFATALGFRMLDKKTCSDLLSLERVGAVSIPGTSYVAELLTPDPYHRLLVIASPLRILNQTDLPLQIRFHDQRLRSVSQLPSAVCDASLLGYKRPACSTLSELDTDATWLPMSDNKKGGFLEIGPHCVCSVPAQALGSDRVASAGVAGMATTRMSVRPSCVRGEFSNAREVGSDVESFAFVCKQSDGRKVHVVCEAKTYECLLPFRTLITTVKLKPTLELLNALPVGTLDLRYGMYSKDMQQKVRWNEVQIPHLSRLAIYSFPVVPNNAGIVVQARLGPNAPWSETAMLEKDAATNTERGELLSLKQSEQGGPAGVFVEPVHSVSTLRFSCPYFFVDRSGMMNESVSGVDVLHRGLRLPKKDGITLLPGDILESSCELVLRSARNPGRNDKGSTKTVRLPPSWTVFSWNSTSAGPRVMCVQTDDMNADDVLGAHCQVMTLRPRLVLTNSSERVVDVMFGDQVLQLAAGQSKDLHWQVKSSEEDHPTTALCFRPAGSPPCEWSGEVLCDDGAAGCTPFLLPSREIANAERNSLGVLVWSVEIAPVRGALAVTFREGSDFVAVNRCSDLPVTMDIRPHGCDAAAASIAVPVGVDVPFGWSKPFKDKQPRGVDVIVNGSRFVVEDVRQTSRVVHRSESVAVAVDRVGTRMVLSLQHAQDPSSSQQSLRSAGSSSANLGALASANSAASGVGGAGGGQASGAADAPASMVLFQVDLRLSNLGISIVEEEPVPREIVYLHLDLIRFAYSKNSLDIKTFSLAISEAQADCQLPGRVDARSSDRRRDDSLGVMKSERPATILANCAAGDRAFLTFLVQRGPSGSRDILLQRTDITLDALEFSIDDEWLDALVTWLKRAKSRDGSVQGVPLRQLQTCADRSILEDYAAPELPKVVQVDQMQIGAVSFNLWCSVKLKTVRFLPSWIRAAIRVLSFSGQFTLDDANLQLPQRPFPPHRGSLRDFVRGIGNEYVLNLINNAASMLGKSSLLNLPRVPLQFGGTILSYVTDSVGLAAGEAASLMAQLTFDDEYIAKQRAIREAKRINGFSDGVVEAGKSLAQGLEGIADIWRKPVEGARRDGFQGLVSGLGMGVGGALVKPISKLGQAISDVGSGIAAQVAPVTASSRRRMRRRMRLPRLLFTGVGAIRPWSELEAAVLRELGADMLVGIEEVLSLNAGPTRMVMLLFTQRFVIARVRIGDAAAAPNVSDTRENGRDRLRAHSAGTSDLEQQPAKPAQHAANGAGAEPLDLFEALDESATKLFSQALKPINTLVYGMQDMNEKLVGTQHAGNEARQGFEIRFADLQNATLGDDCVLRLSMLRDKPLKVSLADAQFGPAARAALVAGFRAAAANAGRMANWGELRQVLLEERRAEQRSRFDERRQSGARGGRAGERRRSGAGLRVLEVFEVERKLVTTGEWKTPFMPMDREFSYRWVDATGARHPHLDTALTREQAAAAKQPPCDLSDLFEAKSAWTIDVRQGSTDAEGWRYGLAWNSSTWDSKPGLFDAIRKRRWTRRYE
eukprot:TRINITY_DN23802_c0_g1_i1.p1 TRINITY_DN23802_c0_g1~~TRINITY_DN23802_c0_g1_i1.p1  ORF type:complete len:2579 (+),score=671.41 TRINITY_DN23802_c0_g1_i1:541-7737(+)